MLRIGFIFPSSDYLYDPFRGDPHTHLQILTVLDGYFGKRVDLSLIDLRGIKKEFAIYHIPECDVYLYSIYTLDFYEQVSILNNLRKRYPRAKHIAGGPHATVFSQECLKIFDSLVIGDGEESIKEVVNDIMHSSLRSIYRERDSIDINRYPYPLRRFLPESTVAREGLMTLKHKPGFEKMLSTTVIFSRGCPYGCYFCDIPQTKEYSPGIRYRSAKLVEEEIEYLKDQYQIQSVSLLDEIGIPLDRGKALSFLEAIGRTGIVWRGQCRVDGLTPETARLAGESGCVMMCLGVESISQQSLDIINKKIKVSQARDTIRLLKENGIESRIYMIIGLPGEPEDIVQRTWEFIEDTGPDLVYLSLFTVRPGTQVYNNPKKFGIKRVNTDWSRTMHMYGRYTEEVPRLTFEYEEHTPWGKGFSSERIINNYLELQTRLREHGLGSL